MDRTLRDLENHVAHCNAQYDCRVCGAMAEYVAARELRKQSYMWATLWMLCGVGFVLGLFYLVSKWH